MSPATPGGRSTPAGGGRVRGGLCSRFTSVRSREGISSSTPPSLALSWAHTLGGGSVCWKPRPRDAVSKSRDPTDTFLHRRLRIDGQFFFPISRRTQVSSAGHRTQCDPAGGKSRWVNFHEPPIKNIDEKSPRPTFGFKLDRDFDETRDLRFVCQPRKTRRDWLIGSLGYRLFP